MSQMLTSQIYLVPVDQSKRSRTVILPPDAGWIFTAPDPSVDAVAESLGDANDRPVQIVPRFSAAETEPDLLLDAIGACVESGPNPVLVMDAKLAENVRQFEISNQLRVQELTRF